MIPKIIHYCWFGRSPLPELAQNCIESWRKYLPDYEIKEWNEDNFDVNIIPYTREAYRLGKYAFVSDYARFWILYRYGGIYFDTDVEVIRNIDDIISCGPFMGREALEKKDSSKLMVASGLGLGAVPGLDLYKMILDKYEKKHLISIDGRITETVVGFVSSLIDKQEKTIVNNNVIVCKGVYIYPSEYFCPKNYFTGEIDITENTRSVHHYAASWTSSTKTFLQKIRKRLFYMYVRF